VGPRAGLDVFESRKSSYACRIPAPDPPARTTVSIPTTLTWLPIGEKCHLKSPVHPSVWLKQLSRWTNCHEIWNCGVLNSRRLIIWVKIGQHNLFIYLAGCAMFPHLPAPIKQFDHYIILFLQLGQNNCRYFLCVSMPTSVLPLWTYNDVKSI
jgi:hypothetical protein